MTRRNLFPSIDALFGNLPEGGSDVARRERMMRFVAEQGPNLQRLASLDNDNAPFVQPDESEFSDAFCLAISSRHTERQNRAARRWAWVCMLARKRERICLLTGRGAFYRWSDGGELPLGHEDYVDGEWKVRTPSLMDLVVDSSLMRALCRWIQHEIASTERFFDELVSRLAQLDSRRTLAGILAVIAASLSSLAGLPAFFDRRVELLTQRVYSAGGQTSLFPPLN